jgi:hypothetical protein
MKGSTRAECRCAAEIRAGDGGRGPGARGGVQGDEGGAGLGHAGLLPWNLACGKATAAVAGVQAECVSQSYEDGGFIEQGVALEAPFPEPPRHPNPSECANLSGVSV